MQVLLNPPRAVLQARLTARAAAGAHFMPLSLLDSQLQQLEVPDSSELLLCFGDIPDVPSGPARSLGVTGGQEEEHRSASSHGSHGSCSEHVTICRAGACSLDRDCFPSTDDIVASIVACALQPG